MSDEKRIKKFEGFKKFSDIKGGRSKIEEVDASDVNPTELELPANPNLPRGTKRIEKPMSRRGMLPEDEKEFNEPVEGGENSESEYGSHPLSIPGKQAVKAGEMKEKVEMYGKVAKFPKKTKASKAYNFLENVKISKNSIWYLMVEKQDNELQMVKYNNKKGVDLGRFVNELKQYYLKKYASNKRLCKLVESIEVGGKNEFSVIKNIPKVEVEGRKLISIITEDLIKLLSK